jgi:hypothetical protein
MIPPSRANSPSPPSRIAGAAAVLGLALLFTLVACAGDRSSPAAQAGGASRDSLPSPLAVDSAGAAGERPPDAGLSASDDGTTDSSTGAAGAVAVIREYYAAISAQRLHDAYHLWSDNGAASKQTFEEFAQGFDDTRSVSVTPGPPGRIEGAAGSRFVEIPVTIDAVAASGEHRRFTGSYVLRRAVVPGATPEQRSWRIYTAQIRSLE